MFGVVNYVLHVAHGTKNRNFVTIRCSGQFYDLKLVKCLAMLFRLVYDLKPLKCLGRVLFFCSIREKLTVSIVLQE